MHRTSVQKEMIYSNNNGGIKMKQFIKNLLNKRLNNEKGLTLIELLAVIVILGIIAAIAVPAITGIINDSEIKATKADALTILNAANLYAISNPSTSTVTINHTTDKGFDGHNIADYIQNLGSFENEAFTITITNGNATLTATDIGEHLVDFAAAGVNDINGQDADSDGTKVIVP